MTREPFRRFIDLSCDLGEAGSDDDAIVEAAIWPLISSANVACGGHIGDRDSMQRAVEQASEHDVSLGAHPSYPDRQNFGRRSMSISRHSLMETLVEQMTTLAEVARSTGRAVTHVKPHGALYNDAHHDQSLADTIAEAVHVFDSEASLVCARSSAMFRAAQQHGIRAVAEGFADRRYRRDGSLVPRSEPDALLMGPFEAAAQARLMTDEGEVAAKGGERIAVAVETICIHSDMKDSVRRLRAIRDNLTSGGIGIQSCHPRNRV